MFKESTYDIVDRSILIPVKTSTFAIQGDNASRYIKFKITRYADNVDLTQKEIWICFQNADKKTGETQAINIEYTNTILTFDWCVSSEATVCDGEVNLYVEFRKVDEKDKKIYVLKTKPISRIVEKSFTVDGSATEADYTVENEILDANDSHVIRTDLVDTDIPSIINEKTREIIMNKKKVVAIFKDNMSQILSFRIKRKSNGVDRADKTFCFKYQNAKGECDFCMASNVFIYDDEIHISWALDNKVTKFPGTVVFSILILGETLSEDGKPYAWNSKTSNFTVESGLDVESHMVEPIESWFISWAIEADNILRLSSQYANESKDYKHDLEGIDKTVQALVDLATEQANLSEQHAIQANESATELNGLYAVRSQKDNNNPNIFTIVSYYRADDTLYMTSTLESIVNTYDRRTEVKYDITGTTEINTNIYPINYDEDNIVTGYFGNLGQLQYHGLL